MLSNPRDLVLQLLSEALWVERMLAFEVLPGLLRECDSEWLSAALGLHLEQTREHAPRLESAFLTLGAEPVSAASEALEGLRRRHETLASKVVEPRLRD